MPYVVAPPGCPPGVYLVDVRMEGPCHAHLVDLAAFAGQASGEQPGEQPPPAPASGPAEQPAGGFDWTTLGRVAGSVLAAGLGKR